MTELNNELTYVLSEVQLEDEDELGFVKGCLSGMLLGIPMWAIIIFIIKLMMSK